MVDQNLIRSLGLSDEDLSNQLEQALGEDFDPESMGQMIDSTVTQFQPGTILEGRIVNKIGNDVLIEVGLKSEGVVDVQEFRSADEITIGDKVEVLLEAVEGDGGLVLLSKRKADRIRGWERIIANNTEGDVVTGTVTRKIKGGLLVDIGVPVFLPASQVDIRRPPDIGAFIGREIEGKILKIDEDRRNIVISRRKLIEERRQKAKEKLMAEIEVGELRSGVVKNIADFGAFVDLGGVDGLLHITDMSWGRINHPSEVVKIDETIEVMILNVDRAKEKIALGLKQKFPSPWENIEQRYPVNSRVTGKVVNIMSYGAFVQLEEGIEGLVHISEMSWTRRINHPSELVSVDDEIEVVVLDVNKDKQEISLGMKQTEVNPWTLVKQKYPPGTVILGKVRNLTNYGAFVEIEEGIDGLLHVSDLSWTKKVGHPSEMLKKGQELHCVVLSVDEEKMRVALGLKQLTEDPWLRAIPERYLPGQIVRGRVTKLTNFGVFVELEPDLEGLLHVSELADQKVDNPQDVVKAGEEIEVKILRVDIEERKIGLSLKRAQWAAETEQEGGVEPVRRRGGLGAEGGMLGSMANDLVLQTSAEQTEQAEQAEQAGQTEPAGQTGQTEPTEQAGQTEPAEQTEQAEQAGQTEQAEPAKDEAEASDNDKT
ncbi:MAG: 30S ribosomal protein S1 [Planctomycetota bacterium]